MKFLWGVTLVMAVIATLFLFFTPITSPAPQLGAAGAYACALVVIPYVFTRACQEFGVVRAKTLAGSVPMVATIDAEHTMPVGKSLKTPPAA